MKTINIFVLLFLIVSLSPVSAQPFNWETYAVLDTMLTLSGPTAPIIRDDFVIFTADSSLRRVGVAFAHEHFGTVHWFRPLVVTQDHGTAPIPVEQRPPNRYTDSGIQFYVYQIPEEIGNIEYRLIVNGLWTVDPNNDNKRLDHVSGLTLSVVNIPQRRRTPNPLNGLPNGLTFTYHAPPGETVSVAGDFNNWDPFMYELREGPAGVYSITLPLPPGTYQYVFFHRGQRYVDPYNPSRIYARNGTAASVLVVP